MTTRTFRLERWIYYGMGLALAASAVRTLYAIARDRRRVRVVRVPDALEEEGKEPMLPTIEQLLASAVHDDDTFDVLEVPALDDGASDSIEEDSLLADELSRN
ncbi:MAG: hypothetical protein ABI321_12600 [Polyangia bacterium]